LATLKRISQLHGDTEAARLMQQAKQRLFKRSKPPEGALSSFCLSSSFRLILGLENTGKLKGDSPTRRYVYVSTFTPSGT
jgi:hypothetical protein